MKKTYISPITMLTDQQLSVNLLDQSEPHVNGDGNVEIPGGGQGGDADDGCVKEFNEIELESETNPFENGLW